jgi:hypothetical protein
MTQRVQTVGTWIVDVTGVLLHGFTAFAFWGFVGARWYAAGLDRFGGEVIFDGRFRPMRVRTSSANTLWLGVKVEKAKRLKTLEQGTPA